MKIKTLKLAKHITKILNDNKIKTISDLRCLTKKNLEGLKGIGQISAFNIKQKLNRYDMARTTLYEELLCTGFVTQGTNMDYGSCISDRCEDFNCDIFNQSKNTCYRKRTCKTCIRICELRNEDNVCWNWIRERNNCFNCKNNISKEELQIKCTERPVDKNKCDKWGMRSCSNCMDQAVRRCKHIDYTLPERTCNNWTGEIQLKCIHITKEHNCLKNKTKCTFLQNQTNCYGYVERRCGNCSSKTALCSSDKGCALWRLLKENKNPSETGFNREQATALEVGIKTAMILDPNYKLPMDIEPYMNKLNNIKQLADELGLRVLVQKK